MGTPCKAVFTVETSGILLETTRTSVLFALRVSLLASVHEEIFSSSVLFMASICSISLPAIETIVSSAKSCDFNPLDIAGRLLMWYYVMN